MNNQKFNNRNTNDFDLDAYLDEKSNHTETDQNPPAKENEGSSWFKNVLMITGLSIVALLYFNDWNPYLVYGNIFGVEKYQNVVVVDPNPADSKIIVIDGKPVESTVVVTGVDPSELEDMAIELQSLEELEGLGVITGEALASAFEALESLEGLESLENLEGLESLENLEGLESLEALEALDNLEIAIDPIEMQEIQAVTEQAVMEAFRALELLGSNLAEQSSSNFNSDMSSYSDELVEFGLGDKFSESSIRKLHQSEIPTSFLKKLDDLGLLDNLSTDSIINAFEIENEE
ncbi:MAG: hypothetical protein RLN81_16320 [Balneolaceae bacterium]